MTTEEFIELVTKKCLISKSLWTNSINNDKKYKLLEYSEIELSIKDINELVINNLSCIEGLRMLSAFDKPFCKMMVSFTLLLIDMGNEILRSENSLLESTHISTEE